MTASTSGWPELVTTALLGTDRRPVPDDLDLGWGVVDVSRAAQDPPSTVLGLAAARHAATRAGSRLEQHTAPSPAPGERVPPAPAPAQELLATLLVKPDPGLVNEWLSCCAACGLGVAVELWPRLAGLAARQTAYDRTLLVQTLGPRGRWFLDQNPAWARVVATAGDERAAAPPGDPEAALGCADQGDSAQQAMALILGCADPLSTELVLAALRLVATGALGADTRAAAGELGYRIPLTGWSDVAQWAATDERPRQPVPAALVRTVQFSLDLVERIVRARIEIHGVFTEAP